uniref:Uncharacterized protein n=1 Tax=Oryza sativa subsp. japonica TaxID=39947 RepID=Q69RQ9_ORYSJ|nr:hypothetical protein [Oryza sativa Japonica Group]BAD31036.1 hypothetical protein [Oryza sativa Japonica Group]
MPKRRTKVAAEAEDEEAGGEQKLLETALTCADERKGGKSYGMEEKGKKGKKGRGEL